VTGNIVITAVAEVAGPAYTNQIPISTDASGNLFVGTSGEKGYKTGYRLSMSSASESAASGYEVSGFIPVKEGDVIRIKNVDIMADGSSDTKKNMVFYKSDRKTGAADSGFHGQTLQNVFITKGTEESDGVYKSTLDGSLFNYPSNVAYLRIGSKSITADSILTINEPIV
jgi:hypothetical protein